MPRKKISQEETIEPRVSLKDDVLKDTEEEDDPSPKKVASDDDEQESEDLVAAIGEEDEDDPIADFLTDEEESW